MCEMRIARVVFVLLSKQKTAYEMRISDWSSDVCSSDLVIKTEIDGATSNGWIDCYKRGSFILEAKQGSSADLAAVDAGQGYSLRDFFGQTAEDRFKRGMARRDTAAWTGAMQRAASQAEGYAKNLPRSHGWPPFRSEEHTSELQSL